MFCAGSAVLLDEADHECLPFASRGDFEAMAILDDAVIPLI